MPRRTNLQQAAIFYAKRHLAPADVAVTESKELPDAESGELREVDVVMESMVAGVPVVISIEVTARKRRMDLTWVEQMIGKHQRMPTSTLVLVSWSGFTGPALDKVERQGGRVHALTPVPLPDATMPPLYYQELNTTPKKAALLVRNGDGTLTRVSDVPILANIYTRPDHESFVFTLRDLVLRILNEGGGGDELSRQAYDHRNRDSLSHFSMQRMDLDEHEWYVHDGEAFRRLSAFDVSGPITLRRQPMDFTAMKLGDEFFAFTEIEMAGKSAVWVLTPKDDHSATISWRLL